MRKLIPTFLLIVVLLTACGSAATETTEPVTEQSVAINADPIQTYMPPPVTEGEPQQTPTPDLADYAFFFPTYTPFAPVQAVVAEGTPTAQLGNTYTVEDNDIWGTIAEKLNVSVEDLLAANNSTEYDIIYPGDVLQVPTNKAAGGNLTASSIGELDENIPTAEYFKIIPDSELVLSPLTAKFEVASFVSERGGYLNNYTQDVDGRTLSGAQIVDEVSRNYSVNPRLLLSILEYSNGWVTQAEPADLDPDFPIAYFDDYHTGLYRQMMYTARLLNTGYYGWKTKQITYLVTQEGSKIMPAAGTNAGTVGIQALFAFFEEIDRWKTSVGPAGVISTYTSLFGDPFQYRVEPLLPPGYFQPQLSLPFKAGEDWHFTGGPHAGWDDGSAWAAIDFAPPGEPLGCQDSEYWSTAVAAGIIARSDNGVVVLDLDGDGYEQTGWTILYLHMATDGRAAAGTKVKEGDPIGHPSCEGGAAVAAHLHIARRFNGVWIPAFDQTSPFDLGGYKASATGPEYDGILSNGTNQIEAQDGYLDTNIIRR